MLCGDWIASVKFSLPKRLLIHFARHHVYAVRMMLHREMQRRLSLVWRSLAVSIHRGQRGIHVVQKGARSGGRRGGVGVLGNTVTAFIPRDQWQSPSPALSKIVLLPSVNVRHIRDR